MQCKRFYIGSIALTAIAGLLVLSLPNSAMAQQETVLQTFSYGGGAGNHPYGGLVFDKAGNLYGANLDGGSYNGGTVFELISRGGGWELEVVHTFTLGISDGTYPQGNLIFDASGNLYGTTYNGGKGGFGTVFEMTPQAGGGWSERVLHNFAYTRGDGGIPNPGLVFDAAGNLYGTTANGGTSSCAHGCGTVFELTPGAGGVWTETIVHNFTASDGFAPTAGLVADAAGNLYGTTTAGGAFNAGTVFQLTHTAGGQWNETVLHSFRIYGQPSDGVEPIAGLVIDATGNLYGTTSAGGSYLSGTVFELSPGAGGAWTETVLHSFGAPGDGNDPDYGALVMDAAGNLYGATNHGGANGAGTAYKLAPAVGGNWTETVLHSFTAHSDDGSFPYAGLIFDGAGNLYGTTTSGGGTSLDGTVFEIAP